MVQRLHSYKDSEEVPLRRLVSKSRGSATQIAVCAKEQTPGKKNIKFIAKGGGGFSLQNHKVTK